MPAINSVLRAITDAFLSLALGDSDQPAQTSVVLPGGSGDCIFYPAYVSTVAAFGVKVSPYLVSRSKDGLSPITAYTLIISAETGLPIMLIDSKRLTTERTAATTLLGVQALTANSPPTTIGIVGTGPIGRSHARYANEVFPTSEVIMYSPCAAEASVKGEFRRKEIQEECSSARCVIALSDILPCDVIMLCTSSGTPVIDVGLTSCNAIITSVGTNLPFTHEIDWRWLPELDVFCDYRRTCPTTAGDLRLAINAGIWSPVDLKADLPEMLSGMRVTSSGSRKYFRATGLALEDITIAALVAPTQFKNQGAFC